MTEAMRYFLRVVVAAAAAAAAAIVVVVAVNFAGAVHRTLNLRRFTVTLSVSLERTRQRPSTRIRRSEAALNLKLCGAPDYHGDSDTINLSF